MNIPAFLVYCAIMAVTPGPNNLMSLYLGASGGSRFWRFFAGSMAGLFVKCALCGLLNVLLAEKIPALVPYLKWLGALYMLYLAFGMVRRLRDSHVMICRPVFPVARSYSCRRRFCSQLLDTTAAS